MYMCVLNNFETEQITNQNASKLSAIFLYIQYFIGLILHQKKFYCFKHIHYIDVEI